MIDTFKRLIVLVVLGCGLIGCASTTKVTAVGVDRKQLLLVSPATVEKASQAFYVTTAKAAQDKGILIRSGPEYDRLKTIATKLREQAEIFRTDTKTWPWSLALIDAPILNASCGPGGRITFYTGIIRQLNLTDDEIAAIMGHEIAHALREHGREKMSEAVAANMVSNAALASASNSARAQNSVALANLAAKFIFFLPNSREKESEADKIGLELSARAGYDPAAAVSLWRKMAAATQGKTPPQFLSTHPSPENRIAELERLQPVVHPLYLASNGLAPAKASEFPDPPDAPLD